MTNINKILSRANCASNHAATGVYQGDVLSPRYRVRVDPERDLFCVVDREAIAWYFRYYCVEPNHDTWGRGIGPGTNGYKLYWPIFDDALAFAKLLDKAV